MSTQGVMVTSGVFANITPEEEYIKNRYIHIISQSELYHTANALFNIAEESKDKSKI